MKLSKPYKEMLLKEIDIVRERMKKETDPRRKIFFYSAIYTELLRLYNLDYHPHLQFIHFVLNVSYNALNARLGMIASGDPTVQLPDNFFEELDKLLWKLQDNIKNDEDTYLVLEKIANLTYLLSGNGYYLSQKGVKVFSP